MIKLKPGDFDNIVVSQTAWDAVKESLVPKKVPILCGVKVVIGRWMPDNCAILRSGDQVVAVVNWGKQVTK